MSKFNLRLAAESIDEAIRGLEEYSGKVQKAGENLAYKLTEQGVSLAQQNAAYMDIYDSGKLVNGIEGHHARNVGKIVSTAEHSAFCEFGTGVVGAGNPHPEPKPGWLYDVNEHGEEGWWYYDESGRKWWTKGMPSRPFMYDTAKMLRNMVEPMAKEVLK